MPYISSLKNNIKKNILIVSQDKKQENYLSGRFRPQGGGKPKNFSGFYLELENTNWISQIPEANKNYTAQIRYHGEFLSCQIKIFPKNKAEVLFSKSVMVASGQSVVIYDGDICLGGGVVA